MRELFCVVLALLIGVYGMAPVACAADTSQRNHRPISIEALEEMSFDYETFSALAQEIMTEAQDEKQLAQVREKLETLREQYLLLETKMELSSIATYRDVTDAAATEEYLAYMELHYDAVALLGTVIPAVLESPCEAAVEQSDSVLSGFLYGGESYSDEDMALIYEEQELVDQYYVALNQEYSAEYEGESYTQTSADTAWAQWELSDEAYDEISTQLAKAQNDATADYYVKLVANRRLQAESYGYRRTDRFYDVMYYGRDITQREREEMYRAVKSSIVPVLHALEERINTLYETADYQQVHYSEEMLLSELETGVSMISESFLPALSYMTEFGYYDITADDKKAATAFTTYLDYPDAPYLLMNPSDSSYDFSTIVHEFGHYYAFFNSPDPGSYNLDLAEIHSQGLELLMLPHYGVFFGAQAELEQLNTIYAIVMSLVDGCMFDELERYAYGEETLTVDSMNAKYMELLKEYGYRDPEDPAAEAYGWVATAHLFDYPMYYYSYGVSAAAALGLWEESQSDYDEAVADYLSLVEMGEVGTFKDTMLEIGMEEPLSYENIVELANEMIDVFELPVGYQSPEVEDIPDVEDISEEDLLPVLVVVGVIGVVWLTIVVIVMVWAVRKEKKRREEYRKYLYRRAAVDAYRGGKADWGRGNAASPAGGEAWWRESGGADDRPGAADPSVRAAEEDETSGFDR